MLQRILITLWKERSNAILYELTASIEVMHTILYSVTVCTLTYIVFM